MDILKKDIHDYWNKRSESYSEINKIELRGQRSRLWETELLSLIRAAFPNRDNKDIKILDIGTGPGIFSILMARNGFEVCGIDASEDMLAQAGANAGEYEDKICFRQMDAEKLDFADDTFDVILMRNVTWNLENPLECYSEWHRVLRPDGRLIIFDANWYLYLFDQIKSREYEQDRENVKEEGLEDFNVGEGFDRMEQIAKVLPLSKEIRPDWDQKALIACGYSKVFSDVDVWKRVWDHEEQINFASTPMFLIQAVK